MPFIEAFWRSYTLVVLGIFFFVTVVDIGVLMLLLYSLMALVIPAVECAIPSDVLPFFLQPLYRVEVIFHSP